MLRIWVASLFARILGVGVLAAVLVGCARIDCAPAGVVPVSFGGANDQTRFAEDRIFTWFVSARPGRAHRGKGRRRWHSEYHHTKHVEASTHRGKGRRRWRSHYHYAKHIKAVLKTPYRRQKPDGVKKQIAVVQPQVLATRTTALEKPIQLKQAPGRDKVEAHCGTCHSLDYVIMNSPFLNASGWDAEVAKMINAFGAPIDQSDAEIIADYLKRNYGM